MTLEVPVEPPDQEQDAPRPRSERDPRTLALYLTVFFTGLGSGVAVPILPELQAAFGLAISQVVLVTSVWAAMRLLTDLPFGFLVDRLPRGRLLLVGTVLLIGGAFVSMLAPTFEALLAGRALTGLASALIGLTAMVSLLAITRPDRRGRTLGFYQATFQAGLSIGPVLAGLAAVAAGWRGAFAVAAVGAVFAALGVLGSGASAPTLPAGRADARRQSPSPGSVRSVRSRMLLYGTIHFSTFALFFVTGGVIDSVLPLFGSSRIGLDPPTIGLILGAAAGLRFLVSILGAELSDRVGRLAVLVVGMAVLFVSLLLMPLVSTPIAFAIVTWSLAVGRLGNAIPIAMLGDVANAARMGRLVGVNRFVADAALTVGPLTVGLVVERSGYEAAFGVTALLVAGSTIAIIAAALLDGGLGRPAETAGSGR